MRAKVTEFLRRPKHDLPLQIDLQAVAVAHHRRYCRDTDPDRCTHIDQTDIDYATELMEVLGHLPPWPS